MFNKELLVMGSKSIELKNVRKRWGTAASSTDYFV